VDSSVQIGEGTTIWAYANVMRDVRIGRNCVIGAHTEIGRGTVIGDGTHIGQGVFIPNNSRFGRDVFVAPKVGFCDDMHPRIRRAWEPPYHAQPPVVEDGAAIGLGSVVLPGIHIGKGAKVAAGSVVTRDVKDYVTVRGGKAAQPVEGPKEWDTETLNDTTEAQYHVRLSSL
jgi:acetyltransferase-like isoleucine patch superfamily enzyme